MRPTFIRLIAGFVLGTAFAVSLVLPGKIVLTEHAPVQHVLAPRPPAQVVVKAAPVPRARPQVAAQPVVRRYEPSPIVRPTPISRVVHRLPARPQRTQQVKDAPAPAAQSLETLSAPPTGQEEKRSKSKGTDAAEDEGSGGDSHDEGNGHEHGHGNRHGRGNSHVQEDEHGKAHKHGHGHKHGQRKQGQDDEHGHGDKDGHGHDHSNGNGNGNGNSNSHGHGHGKGN